jgi:hypothetical protein
MREVDPKRNIAASGEHESGQSLTSITPQFESVLRKKGVGLQPGVGHEKLQPDVADGERDRGEYAHGRSSDKAVIRSNIDEITGCWAAVSQTRLFREANVT